MKDHRSMEQFELPMYFIYGIRPVKLVRDENGNMIALTLNIETGDFELEMGLLEPCLFDASGDVRTISEDAFIQHVERARGRSMKNRDESTFFPLYDLIERETDRMATDNHIWQSPS